MITGVLLAAGRSQRMGQPKLLLPWHGVQLVRHVAQTALQSPLDRLVVVVGHRAAHVEAALAGLPLEIVQNDQFMAGQSTSLRVGVEAARSSDAIVVLLADQPLLQPATIAALRARYKRDRPAIVVPRYHGERGNPVLWDRSMYERLRALSGDQGGRGVLHEFADAVAWVDVDDPGIVLDVDTPTAYAQLLERA